MKKYLKVILFLLFVVTVFSCSEKRKYNLPIKTLVVVNDASGQIAKVEAELAKKVEERNYGFMNRKNIPDGTGMLFVFEKDQILNFWMKNTPHPLSIAYIDGAGVIADILDMTPFSETSVTSSRSVRYALEVPKGWFEKVGARVGDKVLCLDDAGQMQDLKILR